jgi:hypothetical protein
LLEPHRDVVRGGDVSDGVVAEDEEAGFGAGFEAADAAARIWSWNAGAVS